MKTSIGLLWGDGIGLTINTLESSWLSRRFSDTFFLLRMDDLNVPYRTTAMAVIQLHSLDVTVLAKLVIDVSESSDT